METRSRQIIMGPFFLDQSSSTNFGPKFLILIDKMVSNRPKWAFRNFFLQTSNFIWFTKNIFPRQKQCQPKISYIIKFLEVSYNIIYSCEGNLLKSKKNYLSGQFFDFFFRFFRKLSFWRICQLWLQTPRKNLKSYTNKNYSLKQKWSRDDMLTPPSFNFLRTYNASIKISVVIKRAFRAGG